MKPQRLKELLLFLTSSTGRCAFQILKAIAVCLYWKVALWHHHSSKAEMGHILLAKSACLTLCTSHQLAGNFSGSAFLILQVLHSCAFPHLNNKHLSKAESNSTQLGCSSIGLGWQAGELWAEGYRQGRALIVETVLCKGKKKGIFCLVEMYFQIEYLLWRWSQL